MERRNRLHDPHRAPVTEALWLVAVALLVLPLLADHVSGWLWRGLAGIAGLSG